MAARLVSYLGRLVVDRIFLILALVGNSVLIVALALGWSIGDGTVATREVQSAVGVHMLVAMGAALIVLLVHAVALTYFMGTGRWIEETSTAYQLGDDARRRNIQLKYRILLPLVLSTLLVLATGAFGAIADPTSDVSMPSAKLIHFSLAISTLLVNIVASVVEYTSIRRNGDVVNQVVQEVNRIRVSKGLEVG
ncbi:MAG: hypothetical protein R3C01_11650 [Planctomycetaceae bacterium]